MSDADVSENNMTRSADATRQPRTACSGGHCCGPEEIHDHGHAEHGAHAHEGGDSCCAPAPVSFAPLAEPAAVGDAIRTPIRILQMDCPTEEALIRKKLTGMDGVRSMEFNLMQRVLTVVHQTDALSRILEAL